VTFACRVTPFRQHSIYLLTACFAELYTTLLCNSMKLFKVVSSLVAHAQAADSERASHRSLAQHGAPYIGVNKTVFCSKWNCVVRRCWLYFGLVSEYFRSSSARYILCLIVAWWYCQELLCVCWSVHCMRSVTCYTGHSHSSYTWAQQESRDHCLSLCISVNSCLSALLYMLCWWHTRE